MGVFLKLLYSLGTLCKGMSGSNIIFFCKKRTILKYNKLLKITLRNVLNMFIVKLIFLFLSFYIALIGINKLYKLPDEINLSKKEYRKNLFVYI